MKTLAIIAAFSAGISFSAAAVEPMAPVQQQVFTCGPIAGGISHVSTADIGRGCCSPASHCVELLSTTTLEHDSKANRT